MCQCISPCLVELPNIVLRRRGVEGEESTCPPPLPRLNKEVMFQSKATINLDMATQTLIELTQRCPVLSEVTAKKKPPHLLHIPHSPAELRPAGASTHQLQGSKNKVCTKKRRDSACCQIFSPCMFADNMRFLRTRSPFTKFK